MYLSWIQNAEVIVGYNSGRNVHFSSISDLIERPLLIVNIHHLESEVIFFPFMNFFTVREIGPKLGESFKIYQYFLWV